MALYQRFTAARMCEETAFLKIYRLTDQERSYKIVVTKRRANDHTVIHCENRRILWEQVPRFPRFVGRNYGDKVPIFAGVPEKGWITVFVVRGKPDGFVGLDEGVFRCADRFDEKCINVMSERRFKRLDCAP